MVLSIHMATRSHGGGKFPALKNRYMTKPAMWFPIPCLVEGMPAVWFPIQCLVEDMPAVWFPIPCLVEGMPAM